MKITNLILIALMGTMAARADFSYTMTRKGVGAPEVTTQSIKGQKMMIDNPSTTIVMDFDAQTITTVNKSQKTFTMKKFSDVGTGLSGTEMTMDVKETGQKKNINGFDASELLLTVDVDNPQMAGRGMKMQMEMHIWISSAVPGAGELHAFYQRNMGSFPWAAIMQGGNPGMAKTIADLQRKLATMNGVPVLEVMKTKMSGGPSVSPQQQAQMDTARARLEALAQQGGQAGAAAQQALARMGGASIGRRNGNQHGIRQLLQRLDSRVGICSPGRVHASREVSLAADGRGCTPISQLIVFIRVNQSGSAAILSW